MTATSVCCWDPSLVLNAENPLCVIPLKTRYPYLHIEVSVASGSKALDIDEQWKVSDIHVVEADHKTVRLRPKQQVLAPIV